MADIKLYGASWCPDCRRSKKFLAEHRVAYDYIDLDHDPGALRYVEELQRGGRTIPTIVFPDGSYLLEPSDEELARELGLKLVAERSFYDLAIIGGGPAGRSGPRASSCAGIRRLRSCSWGSTRTRPSWRGRWSSTAGAS